MEPREIDPRFNLTDEELDQALCAKYDPEQWFPGSGRGAGRVAKKVCLNCDIRERCLEVAMNTDEPWGVWGGLNQHDRRKLKRRQNGRGSTRLDRPA